MPDVKPIVVKVTARLRQALPWMSLPWGGDGRGEDRSHDAFVDLLRRLAAEAGRDA